MYYKIFLQICEECTQKEILKENIKSYASLQICKSFQEISLVLGEGIVHLTQMDNALIVTHAFLSGDLALWLAKVCFTLISALLLMLVITY